MPHSLIAPMSLPVRRMAFLLGCVLVGLSAKAAVAEPPVVVPVMRWQVDSNFKSKDARTNLSGAACANTTPPLQSCLIVNDEKKYMQFFSVDDGNTIVPGKPIRLFDGDGEPDAEGVAFDAADSSFYVTGSHGRSRHGDRANDASYAVFRFKVDPKTGKPSFEPSEDEVVGVERSGKLRTIIAKAPEVGAFYNKPLDDGGVNIEGLAVYRQRLFFGLRGPSIDGKGFMLSAAIDGIFGDADPQPRVHALALGRNAGVRDLATVTNGLLVLSGPVNEQPVAPAVFHWEETSQTLTKLATLGKLPADAKAETLLVLEEKPDSYRVLVMFDGPENGRPTEYRIPR